MLKKPKKRFNRVLSGVLAVLIAVSNLMQLAASAEEGEKFQYTMFGRNGITMSVTSNLCMNGNLHTNKDAAITATNKNINGKVTTSADVEKRVKHVYADQKIYDTYFTTNCELHEEEYVYSDMNIHINNPLYCYSNITLNGNVSLNSSLGSLMNINVTGEVKNANNSVVYSKYGNITIENDSTANVNGLIYAPLGTVTINSPNVTINGIIIADQVVINGSSVNINCNDNIARFIGETSEEYDFSGLEYLPEEWLGDTDADNLFDIYEKVIDSDPLNPDTDGDGLPDGYEILTLNTDPLEIDTDGNGVLDGNEDFDTDNLVNIDEYLHQTLPFTPDTDEDGFVDGDEVHIYGTVPTTPDTDGDDLLDGEESYDGFIYLEYGVYFDPLNPDTDGDGITDGDEVFGQTKEQEVQTQDEAITEVIVDMETNGNIDRTLTVESMQGIDAMTSNVYALVGEPFNFETESDFESATITFKIDQSKLGDTQFDKLLILWYNEEKQNFEEMPTTHDIVNSTVSTTTTHFSQYMVVDRVEWFNHWDSNIAELNDGLWTDEQWSSETLNTIFLIDCSVEMADVDPITQPVNAWKECKRRTICENIVASMASVDNAAVITFSRFPEFIGGMHSASDSYTLRKEIQEVNNNGNETNVASAIDRALRYIDNDSGEKYRIVILTHSGASFASYAAFGGFDWSNTDMYIVNLGFGEMEDTAERFATHTGGCVYNAVTADQLTSQSGSVTYTPPQFDGTDTDGDTIPDFIELYGLQPNGMPIGTNPKLIDSDGDTIPDNIELGYLPFEAVLYGSSDYLSHFTYRSDPSKIDTDEDGYYDNIDPKVLKKINNSNVMNIFTESMYENLDTYNWVVQMYNDPTVWHGDNTIEHYYEVHNVNAENAEDTINGIITLQKCLEYLGILDMYENGTKVPYGTLGGKTISALQLFQLNYGFEPIDNKKKDIDSNTYQTLLNVAINYGFYSSESLGCSAEEIYCSTNMYAPYDSMYKQYYSDIPVIIPELSKEQTNAGIGVYNLNNPSYKGIKYCFDYSIPLDKKIDELSAEATFWHSISTTGASELILFYSKVDHGEEWDIKVQECWEETIPDIKYYSQKFLFVFNGVEMNSENLGNFIYGCTGRACGCGMGLLKLGSGYAGFTGQSKDDITDINFIQSGYDYYEVVKARNGW